MGNTEVSIFIDSNLWLDLAVYERDIDIVYEGAQDCMCLVVQSCLSLCNAMDLAHQAPLSLGFSRQEYWGGLPCPLPGNLSDPGIKPRSPALQVDSLQSAAAAAAKLLQSCPTLCDPIEPPGIV